MEKRIVWFWTVMLELPVNLNLLVEMCNKQRTADL